MRRLVPFALLMALAACQHVEAPRPVAASAPAIERSAGQAVKDDTIKANLARRIVELDRRAYRAVTVESWGGRVLLMGAVIKPEQRRKAEQAARAQEGVVEVLNELVLAEDRALDSFATDPAREASLRKALGIEGNAGTIARVVNGVAFLLGAAPNPEAAAAMKADATEVEGVKWVVSHLRAQ